MVDELLDDEIELDEIEDEDEADDQEKVSSSPPRRPAPRPQQRSQRFAPSGGHGNYRRPYRSRRKVCAFCVEGVKSIGWKDFERLRRFVNDGGGMRSRRKTGTCAKHQRRLAVAIKRARHLALLSYTVEHVRVMGKS
jgi:small subunit ribosomal protein S18